MPGAEHHPRGPAHPGPASCPLAAEGEAGFWGEAVSWLGKAQGDLLSSSSHTAKMSHQDGDGGATSLNLLYLLGFLSFWH